MYTVIFDELKNRISIEAHTLEALREVATASIKVLACVDNIDVRGNYNFRNIKVLESPPLDIGFNKIELKVSPPLLWKDVEEFVAHGIKYHAAKLANYNLAPLSSYVKYRKVDLNHKVRDSSLTEITADMHRLGVLRAVNG